MNDCSRSELRPALIEAPELGRLPINPDQVDRPGVEA
jgi:hypothetical protein